MLDYNKFKNLSNGLIYIVEGHDYFDACIRSNKIATKENRQHINALIQTPVNSEAGMKFFSNADVVVNIEN